MTTNKSLLSGIPNSLLPDFIDSIDNIEGGMNNSNILINGTYLLKKYLKRDEKNDPVYLRFIREKDSLITLKKIDCIPSLLKFLDKNPDLFIARDWINGRAISADSLISNQKLLNRLVHALTQIHSYTFKTSGDFDYFDVIKRYLREYEHCFTMTKRNKTLFNNTKLPKPKILSDYFLCHLNLLKNTRMEKLKVRIHGDLVFSNIIMTDDERNIMVIDWEYSTRASPYIDLAYLVTQNSINKSLEKIIIKKYQLQSNFIIDKQVFSEYKNLMNLMSGLWFIIHAYRLSEGNMRINSQQSTQIPNILEEGNKRLNRLQVI